MDGRERRCVESTHRNRLRIAVVAHQADIEQSGLLDEIQGSAREERRELVRWLLDRGFDVEQIRNSLSPIMLAANRVIGDDGTFMSSRELAESTELPLDLVQRLHDAAGLARAEDQAECQHARADAESVLPAAALVGLGFDPGEVALIVRLLVDGLTRVAMAMRQAALKTLLTPGATELQLAVALEALALETEPLLDPMINRLARRALRHSFATEAVDTAERAAGTLAGARPVTVAFADFVGFTRLGEALPPQDLVKLAGRLAALTRRVVGEPVQFVKTIGDAVMLVSPDAEKLMNAVLELLDTAAAEQLPQLRAGAATGLAVSRAGDWYGSAVNLASRVAGVARPGVLLVTESTRVAVGDRQGVGWSGPKVAQLRGLREEVRLFYATRVPHGGRALACSGMS
jgi:adenylate cyclase